MALKWRKDGTAKCGPLAVEVFQGAGRYGWDQWRWNCRDSTGGGAAIPNTSAEAKRAAETWLRKQAKAMRKDLKGDPSGKA